MFYRHSVLEVDGKEVLYLYLNSTYEFAQDFYGNDRQRSIYERVTNYIRNRGIQFAGDKVYLVVNGIIVSSLTIQPFIRDGKQDVDQMIPLYKYVEIIQDLAPKDIKIEVLNTSREPEVKAGKFISLTRSSGILERFLLEDYAFGIVSSEMPLYFEKEARKARAVLARTYALRKEEDKQPILEKNSTQILSNRENLESLWKEHYYEFEKDIKEAVKETKGEYLTYRSKPIDVYTHMVNHGKTESAKDFLFKDIPYLVSVDSPWDLEELVYTSSISFSYEKASKLLNQKIDKDTKIEIISRTAGNRIKQLQIGKYRYRTDYLYYLLGLRSTDFSIKSTEEGLIFTFHSLETGLGMSIHGANGMAKKGFNYKKILAHYFPNTKIKKIS